MFMLLMLSSSVPIVACENFEDGESTTGIFRILKHFLVLWLVKTIGDFIYFRRGRRIESDHFEMFVDAFLANSDLYRRVLRQEAYQSLWEKFKCEFRDLSKNNEGDSSQISYSFFKN